MNAALTALELAIMEKLLDGEEPVLLQLRNQLGRADVVSREVGPYGFYVYFQVPSDLCRVNEIPSVKAEFTIGDVQARVGSKDIELGFLLWVKNGHLDCLEGYSYGEIIPTSIESFMVAYIEGNERDIETLRNQWLTRQGGRVAEGNAKP